MTPNATNYVTEARTGLWTTSSDEELWPGDAFFVDWRDAVRYGLDVEHTYIGRVVELTDDDVAAAFVRDADEASEYLGLQDEWSWCEDPLVRDPLGDARAELLELVRAWVQKHKLRVPAWHVMDSQALPDPDEAEEFILSGELDEQPMPPVPPGHIEYLPDGPPYGQPSEPDPEVLRVQASAAAPAGDQQADRRPGAADGAEPAAERGDECRAAQAARGEGLLRPGEAVAHDGAEVDLRPATVDDLVPGAEVWYTPLLNREPCWEVLRLPARGGEREAVVGTVKAFRGTVGQSTWPLAHGAIVTTVRDLEPAYADYVGMPGKTVAWGVILDALYVRKAQGGAK